MKNNIVDDGKKVDGGGKTAQPVLVASIKYRCTLLAIGRGTSCISCRSHTGTDHSVPLVGVADCCFE